MTANVISLDKKSFRTAVRGRVALVDFWEPWCGPCQVQLPVLEEVARRVADRAIVAKVDVDQAQSLAAHVGIQSLPTVVLFKDGRVVRQFVGDHSVDVLAAAVDHALVADTTPGSGRPRRRRVRRTSS